MELFVREYMAISFLVVGVSHIINWKLWSSLFEELNKSEFAPLIIAVITFPIGLMIVMTHNFWAWHPAVMITVFGWAMMIKSIVYALYPKAFQRVIDKNITDAEPKRILLNKMFFALIAGICLWILSGIYLSEGI